MVIAGAGVVPMAAGEVAAGFRAADDAAVDANLSVGECGLGGAVGDRPMGRNWVLY